MQFNILIIDDEKTAKNIKDKVIEAIKHGNPEGLVRHFKSARVKVNELVLSSGMMIRGTIIMIIMSFMALLIVV